MVKYRLKITDIVEEAFGTQTYYMEMPKDFIWDEGSHAHIGLEGYDKGEKPVSEWVRHMSIMTLPAENKIGFTTRKRENCSEFKQKLFDSKVGDEIVVFKPGSRMALRREQRPVVLISMGVGIATMRPLLLAYEKESVDIPVMLNINVDSSGVFLYKNDLERISCDGYRNYWLDRRQEMHDLIDSLSTLENPIYYLVGSDPFITDLIHRLKKKGVPIEDIMIDKKPEFISRFLMISPGEFNVLL
jgi:ferredoxin-NADP reductase